MQQQSQDTTRKHRRAELDAYVNKIVGDAPHLARIRDISASGVYLYRLLEPVTPPDQDVGLEIMLPNSGHVIWAVGEVVRREESELAEGDALRFTRITAVDRQMIQDYVNQAKNTDREKE